MYLPFSPLSLLIICFIQHALILLFALLIVIENILYFADISFTDFFYSKWRENHCEPFFLENKDKIFNVFNNTTYGSSFISIFEHSFRTLQQHKKISKIEIKFKFYQSFYYININFFMIKQNANIHFLLNICNNEFSSIIFISIFNFIS